MTQNGNLALDYCDSSFAGKKHRLVTSPPFPQGHVFSWHHHWPGPPHGHVLCVPVWRSQHGESQAIINAIESRKLPYKIGGHLLTIIVYEVLQEKRLDIKKGSFFFFNEGIKF